MAKSRNDKQEDVTPDGARRYGGLGNHVSGNLGPGPMIDQIESEHSHRDLDPDYQDWRQQQMLLMDEDYRAWKRDGGTQFSEDFVNWRAKQQR